MTSMRTSAWWRPAAWSVLGLAVAASAWCALAVARGPGRATTYAGSSDLAAAVWFAPVWVGWQQGPMVARSAAMVAAGFVLPLLVHVVLTHPTGRSPTPAARVVVLVAYAEASVVAVASALFRDPFDDPYA